MNETGPSALPERRELEQLQARLQEAEAVLHAIRYHEVDAFVAKGPRGDQVYTLSGADQIYRALVDSMYEDAVALVVENNVLFCSRSFADLVGEKEQQIIGAPIARYVVADDKPLLEELLSRAMEGKASGELRLLKADGNHVPAYLALRVLPLEQMRGVCIVATDISEQKRDHELVAQERLARAILAQVSEALVVCDTQDIIIRASDKANELAGRPVVGLPFAAAFALQFELGAEPSTLSSLNALCAGNERVRREGTYVSPEGPHNLLVSAGPLRGDDTALLGYVLTLTEITDAKRTAAALHQSEARFRTALEFAPVPILVHTLDGDIIEVNRAFTELTGYSHAEVPTGREWFLKGHRLPEEQVDEVLREANEKLRDGTQEPAEVPIWTKWGERRVWLFYGSRPVTMPDGRQAVISSAVDITERRRAEAALQESRTRFELATRAARELIYDYDLAAGTAWRSPGLFELIGVRPEEAKPTARWWRERVYPDDLARIEDEYAAALAAGQTHLVTQYRVRDADGEYIWVEDRALILRDASGAVARLVGSTFSIEERMRREAQIEALNIQLQQADQRKDDFIATLAHELRNPLAPIRNAAALLRVSELDAAMGQRAIEMIERHVRQLARLVDDLLDVSRIVKGKVSLDRQPVLLTEVVENAVETTRSQIVARKHVLSIQLPTQPVWMEGDQARLTQVLVNMLDNAAKYTDDGGHIQLTAECADGEVKLCLMDNGMGMTAEVLRHAFDMFSQADHVVSRSYGGLGIGLTLVRNLVAMHGGSIEAFSAGAGKGSKFVLRLPTISPPLQAERDEDKASESAGPLRILVVDDNIDAAESMALLLQLQGHEAVAAEDGPEALEIAKTLQPEVVLLDIGLPSMDGYEVAARLRAMPESSDALLVALTGYGQADDHRRSKEAGFDYHLVKPVEMESIRAILAARSGATPES